MTDRFSDFRDSAAAPARRCFLVVPSDTNPLQFVTKGIRAGGTGQIRFRAVDSDTDVTHPVIAGERIDVRISHLRATGTDVDVIGYA